MKQHPFKRSGIFAGLILLAQIAGGQVPAASEAGFVPLVVGDSMEHWRVLPGNQGHWKAVDGVIDCDGRSTEVVERDKNLYSKKWYRNFILRLDWRFAGPAYEVWHRVYRADGSSAVRPDGRPEREKIQSAGDSGIYLRSMGKAQVNLWNYPLGSGNITGYFEDTSLPLEKRLTYNPPRRVDKPLGEWNALEVTLVDQTLTVVLNGVTVIDRVVLPDIPYGGPIGLQHPKLWNLVKPINGKDRVPGPTQFRNVRIKEL